MNDKLIDDGRITPEDVRGLARRVFNEGNSIETDEASARVIRSIEPHFPDVVEPLCVFAVKTIVAEVGRSIKTPGGHRVQWNVKNSDGTRRYDTISMLSRDELKSLTREYRGRSDQNAEVADYLARVDEAMGDAALGARVGDVLTDDQLEALDEEVA